ncbi:MAG: DeoR/GlpR family DNA-binding transcription regulator [Parvibaculaceae bacterium]
MRARERQELIAEVVSREGKASVEHLAQRLDVSVETIRRDLGFLDDHGIVKKIHGGATRLQLRKEGSFSERAGENVDAKRAIANKLFDVIEDGATLFIDTGSTTLACAEVLAVTKTLTVVTNSARIASTFAAAGRHKVFLLGGEFGADNAETLGAMTLRQVADFHADYALISPAAVESGTGVTDADFGEASVARAMIEQAEKLIVVADHSKFEKRAAHLVSRLDQIDVFVCDREPDTLLRQRLETGMVILRS